MPARKSTILALTFVVISLFSLSARAEPAMWVIKDQDSTIYLIGTVHLLKHDAEWNSAKVQKAVGESKELWLEVADDNPSAVTILIQRYGYEPDKPLSSKLDERQKAKLAKVAEEYHIPMQTIDPMRPWMAAVMFTALPLEKAGFDPNAGVDRALKTQAQKEGDKVLGFETMDEQIQFLAELPERDQIAFLEDSLDDATEGIALLDKLATAWLKGDNKVLGDVLVDEVKKKTPEIYQKLIVDRNIHWSEKIAKMMEGSGVEMIAVGAGHLAGPDSLQVQLEKRGIKVESY